MAADAAGNLTQKKENEEQINAQKQLEKPAASDAAAVEPKNGFENSAKKVLRVLPSRGEPCGGTDLIWLRLQLWQLTLSD